MLRETLLFSVRPIFVDRLLEGAKRVELRRMRPDVTPGMDALIYSSTPTKALLASAVVDRVEASGVEALWPRVRDAAGVTRSEYSAYFEGTERAVGIWLSDVRALKRPLGLQELRERWPWFRPPQSYCYVRASLYRRGRPATELALAPRT